MYRPNPFAAAPSSWISPSLNRVRFVPISNTPFSERYENRSAYDLLSANALRRCAEAKATEKRISIDGDALLLLDRWLRSDNPRLRSVSGQIAADYGSALAYLLLMLKIAKAPERRRIRSDWTARHWSMWQSRRVVHCGGGILSGEFGTAVVAVADQFLRLTAGPDLAVRLAANASYLPLIGTACYHAGESTMVVLDFGHTSVKSGFVEIHAGTITALHVRSPVPVPNWLLDDAVVEKSLVRIQLSWMASIIADAWLFARHSSGRAPGMIGVSLACYLFREQPYPGEDGLYGRLQKLGNVRSLLEEEVGRRLGNPVTMRLVHDGTAAAAVFSREPTSAVVLMGTAVGSGFPGSGPAPARLTSEFQLKEGKSYA